MPERVAEASGRGCYEAPFVLEGGAFNTDGEGHAAHHRAVPAAQPQPGPVRARDYEAALREWLGVEKVIWLPFGLVEDSGPLSTAGHVDDVAQFVAPGVVLAQTVRAGQPEPLPPAGEPRGAARGHATPPAAGCEVVEMALLPYVAGVGPGSTA